MVHLTCSFSIRINVTVTVTREAKIKAHEYKSKGITNVRYSSLSGGAGDKKPRSYCPIGPMKSLY